MRQYGVSKEKALEVLRHDDTCVPGHSDRRNYYRRADGCLYRITTDLFCRGGERTNAEVVVTVYVEEIEQDA